MEHRHSDSERHSPSHYAKGYTDCNAPNDKARPGRPSASTPAAASRHTWYADTLLSKVKSKLGNTCANVYTQGKFTRVVPMVSRKDAGKSLIEFTDDVGIPDRLVTDGATEFTGRHTEFVKEARHMRISLTYHGTRTQESEPPGRTRNWILREALEIADDEKECSQTTMGLRSCSPGWHEAVIEGPAMRK